ncbi:MAG: hypothetical protein COC01_05590 [Bacteroidetes bacterium]|nr:MAG: hypothetical protein COC01_05590 [Bacteroidota bacterium]
MQIKKGILKHPFIIITALFFLSVLVRLPHIDRPLSKHHELCTANAIRFISFWDDNGSNPPILGCNHTNKADKFIKNYSSNIKDEYGNYYYISFGPFAYLLPYTILKALSIKVSALALQIFNLIFHLISAIFIYKIISTLYNSSFKELFFPAFFSSVTYLFAPGNLWFHCNIYVPEIFSQNLVIITSFYLLSYLQNSKERNWLFTCLIGFMIFIITYTDWIGIFMLVPLLILYAKRKLDRKLIFTATTGSLLAIALILFQYSSIDGFDSLINTMTGRYIERAGINSITNSPSSFFILSTKAIYTYITSYLTLILLGLVLVFLSVRWKTFKFSLNEKYATLLTVLPAFVYYFIFIDAAGHDYYSIKGAFFLSIIVGILIHKSSLFLGKKIKAFLLLSFLILSVSQYYYINRPGEYSYNGFRYDTYKKLGEFIGQNSTKDEVIIVKDLDCFPQILVYAKRNILHYTNEKEIIQYLKKHGHNKVVIFEVSDEYEIKILKRIDLESSS